LWLIKGGHENSGKHCKISALGRADLDAVYVEHPIQNQTPQEIAAKAEAVIGEIVARLTVGAAIFDQRPKQTYSVLSVSWRGSGLEKNTVSLNQL